EQHIVQNGKERKKKSGEQSISRNEIQECEYVWKDRIEEDSYECRYKEEDSYEYKYKQIKSALKGTVRLWPHKVKGEGHFVAMLEKKSYTIDQNKQYGNQQKYMMNQHKHLMLKNPLSLEHSSSKEQTALLEKFFRENLKQSTAATIMKGNLILVGSNLYYLPGKLPDLRGIKVVKFGWYLGEFLKGRFEPSHSLIIALNKDDVNKVVSFASDSNDIIKYLKGETIITDTLNTDTLKEILKRYAAVCVDGFTVGWAKQTRDMLKNLYPKGWRKLRE
ncbi:MAG: hypothetical protein GYA02_00665, partial [Clostridiaceae bacterium]|nr:hypothetical protein [Clostridiaceae bacterium]